MRSLQYDEGSLKHNLGAGLSALRDFFSRVRVVICCHVVFYDAIPLDYLIYKGGSAREFNEVKLQFSIIKCV